jgi:hypothetical protein
MKVGCSLSLTRYLPFRRDSVNSKATSSAGCCRPPQRPGPAGPVDNAATRVLILVDTATELHC